MLKLLHNCEDHFHLYSLSAVHSYDLYHIHIMLCCCCCCCDWQQSVWEHCLCSCCMVITCANLDIDTHQDYIVTCSAEQCLEDKLILVCWLVLIWLEFLTSRSHWVVDFTIVQMIHCLSLDLCWSKQVKLVYIKLSLWRKAYMCFIVYFHDPHLYVPTPW